MELYACNVLSSSFIGTAMSQGLSQGGGEGEGASKPLNVFSNDGSFMEQFMRMQKEQSASISSKEGEATKTEKPYIPTVSIKLAQPAPTTRVKKTVQSRAAKRAFVDGSDSEGEGERESIERTGTCTCI